MFRFPFLSVVLVIYGSFSAVLAQETKTNTWLGTLDARGIKLRLEIDINQNGDEQSGELRSLDQGNARLELADIKIDSATFAFSIPQLGAEFKGKLSKGGNVATGTFAQNGIDLPLTLARAGTVEPMPELKATETLREAWVGKLQMGVIEPVMQFRVVTLESGETAVRFDSITEARTGFPGTWSVEGDAIRFDIPEIKLSYSGKLNETKDTAEGTWNQAGRAVPLTLKKQLTEYRSEDVWANRPQKPVGPFPYDDEEVKFQNQVDQIMLAGTLTIPQNPGRHPAVVLISGSGPQDRDESLMEHKPFLVLADYLSRRGIAVLRYDDRGFGESTGDFGSATTEDFARDASAAVEFLKTHDRINPVEIGLAGHSEGGLIAPMVVGLRDDIAFVVLLAATGVNGASISQSQSEAMARAAGVGESELEIIRSVNRAVLDIASKAGPDEDLSVKVDEAIEAIIQKLPEADREQAGANIRAAVKGEMQQLQGNWMRFFLNYNPRPALTNIKCPVLAIVGSKDTQVLPELNMPVIQQALAEGRNQDFEIVILDGLNHLFQKSETGGMGEYVTIQETFNPEALKKIGDWIINHTTPVK